MKKILLIIFVMSLASIMTAGEYKTFNFKATDITGKTFELNDFRGKVVILDFWATWCPPCRKEIPVLKDIYEKYREKDFEIVSIALERKPDEYAKEFVKKNNMNWVHIISREKGRELAKLYKIRYIPTMFILDKKGDIVASGLRGEKLKSKIKEMTK